MEDNMGIQEEIFEDFFKKLQEDKKFPDSIIEELKKLWKSGESISQEKISEIIKRECAEVCED